MRPPAPLEITAEEQALIDRGTKHETFIQNTIWLEIERYISAVVEEALDAMRGNQSHESMVAYHMKVVWQEREAFRDRLILYVNGPIKAKRELLRDIERQKEEEKTYGRSAY